VSPIVQWWSGTGQRATGRLLLGGRRGHQGRTDRKADYGLAEGTEPEADIHQLDLHSMSRMRSSRVNFRGSRLEARVVIDQLCYENPLL
jgi:hypothetical protein